MTMTMTMAMTMTMKMTMTMTMTMTMMMMMTMTMTTKISRRWKPKSSRRQGEAGRGEGGQPEGAARCLPLQLRTRTVARSAPRTDDDEDNKDGPCGGGGEYDSN